MGQVPFDCCNCRPLFQPIDYLVFDGLSSKVEVDRIVFVDIKTGHALLNRFRREVRSLVEGGNLLLEVYTPGVHVWRLTSVLGTALIELSPAELGAWIRHGGWTLRIDPTARLIWPIYSYNPCADAAKTDWEHAAAALSVPLRLKAQPSRYVWPNEQEISFSVRIRWGEPS